MNTVLCINDNLTDGEAWMTHLHMRGYETVSCDIKSLASIKNDAWTRTGLLLSHEAAKALATDTAGLAGWCRKLKADRIVVVDKPGETFSLKGEFNGSVLRLTPSIVGWRYASEVAARFLDADQNVAAGDPQTFNLLRLARRVAMSDVTVMLVGPTGTGKEVISKFLHNSSKRSREAFIAVNTLLLDEVSEMAPHLQAKFLRVLQEKEVTPLGGSKAVPIDVRVIATSNRYMMEEVKAGRFREDLYYRLNVFPLATQALAERPGDILPISILLLSKHTGGFPNIPELSDAAIEKLEAYAWPGNVRELENVLQRALVLSGGAVVEPEHLMIELHDTTATLIDFEPVQKRHAVAG